ncbi:MAG: DUF4124 domain-containing protein [Pseudomonadota bacterium]
MKIFLLTMAIPNLATSGEVYRTVDESGQVIFTDTPPTNTTEVETIQLPPGPSAESVRKAEAREEAIRRELESIKAQREQQQKERGDRLGQAEQELAEAEARLIASKEFREGDRQSLAGGKSRIRPEYFQRVTEAEEAVEAARKRLVRIRNER